MVVRSVLRGFCAKPLSWPQGVFGVLSFDKMSLSLFFSFFFNRTPKFLPSFIFSAIIAFLIIPERCTPYALKKGWSPYPHS
ncbi:hypothetical protein F4824DRAFT_480400 [Ustulina deusta]|nr:hypothetical protein F4824DRAFT_480400 [Ustulina deusta]